MAPNGDSLNAPLPILSFDIIVDILLMLPVISLLRFKCVCKSWNSLISDPDFRNKHLRASMMDRTHHHLIFTFMSPSRCFLLGACSIPSVLDSLSVPATELIYPFNNRHRFDSMVGSVHGIVCFAIDQNYALVWNPSIRKFKKLPPLRNERREGSFTVYGFGHDHMRDSYKVVAVFCYEYDHGGNSTYKGEVKVHTLGDNSWRRIQDFPSLVPYDESAKFVSGSLNWLAAATFGSSPVIVSLDLGNESYKEILQSDYGKVVVVTLTLEILRDCLCVVSHCETFSDVWLMKEFGNEGSWTKLCRVPNMGNSGPYSYTKILCVSENGEILLEFESKLLIVYDYRNEIFRTPEIQNLSGWGDAEVSVGSLISPVLNIDM